MSNTVVEGLRMNQELSILTNISNNSEYIRHAFTLFIPVNRIISVNNYLRPCIKTVGIKKIPYLSLSTEAARYKKMIETYLNTNYSQIFVDNNYTDLFSGKCKYETIVEFHILPNRINKVDLTNMKKLCEDSIVSFIKNNGYKYDDRLVFKSTEYKYISEQNDSEMIVFTIRKIDE